MVGKYVPIEDVANHFSVSISTIRAWVRQKEIPDNTYIKVGNTYRFNVDAVSDALTNKSKPMKDNDNIVREPWHHEDDVDKEHGIEKVNLDNDI